jgi:UDP-sugar pyrophosphorylase
MTLNVEYNQLDPLLRATINPEGDVNDPATGHSPFPGNINQLVLALAPYEAQLQVTDHPPPPSPGSG